MTEITVCIATHKRPDGLRKLLESICNQTAAPPFDVIVVDNDAAQSAHPVVAEFQDRLSLRYLVEPIRGLARVRNRAVAASHATFVAFIDDDEWATPEWLAGLYRVAHDTRADAVIGPVRVIFGAEVPAYVRNCRLFSEADRADGEIVPWEATRTGNALVRRSSLPDLSAPFAGRFNLSGGEDVDLFRRMIDAGADIRASRVALVFEDRPASRANLRWIMRRAVRNGGMIADIEWRHLPHGARLRRGLMAAFGAVVPALKASVLWRRDRLRSLHQLVSAAEGLGKLALVSGIRIQEYRSHS